VNGQPVLTNSAIETKGSEMTTTHRHPALTRSVRSSNAAGGIGAPIAAATFIFGIALFMTSLSDDSEGAAGLITLVPGVSDVGMVFGLGSIVWFAWAGVALLRSTDSLIPAEAVAR